MLRTRVENLEEGIGYAIEMIDTLKTNRPDVADEDWRELNAIRDHLQGTLMQPDPAAAPVPAATPQPGVDYPDW